MGNDKLSLQKSRVLMYALCVPVQVKVLDNVMHVSTFMDYIAIMALLSLHGDFFFHYSSNASKEKCQ